MVEKNFTTLGNLWRRCVPVRKVVALRAEREDEWVKNMAGLIVVLLKLNGFRWSLLYCGQLSL
jgi:hypothetical protein